MALVGGGGAGNTAGSNPTGTSKGVSYIGDHVSGISGVIAVPGSETTLMEFNTASQSYILAQIQILNASGSNDDMTYKVYLNDEIVGEWYYTTAANQPEPANPYYLIIPGSSSVKVTALNNQSSSGRNHTATLTGRVYA